VSFLGTKHLHKKTQKKTKLLPAKMVEISGLPEIGKLVQPRPATFAGFGAVALAGAAVYFHGTHPAAVRRVLCAGGALLGGTLMAMTFKPVSSRVIARVLPRVMRKIDERYARARRALLAPLARGKILDLGCGALEYLKHCTASGDAIERYVALEPNVHLQGQIAASVEDAAPTFPVTVVTCFSGELATAGDGAERGTYDLVILGNVLCEVPCPEAVLADVDALLRPGGAVFFSEHVGSPRGSVKRAVQNLINWLWFTVSDGCNCNRDSVDTIRSVLKGYDVKTWEFREGGMIVDRFVLGCAIKK
jgi:2-polyprenyl-3-methyl-5-hydroxy-6-metoxy-1,4-benzoquinol methylase